MSDTIQFTLTAEQMARFLTWRAEVEAATETPIEGVLFSFLIGKCGEMQITVRPSTEEDFKLKNAARTDGSYETFAPHEEILAPYNNFGFASTALHWRDIGIRLWLCHGAMLGRGETPRCYVEYMDEPHRPSIPFRVSEQPELLEEDVLLQVFPYMPLPPSVPQRVQDFIRTNVAVLLQHWHGEIDSMRLLDRLQPPGGIYETEGSPQPPGA